MNRTVRARINELMAEWDTMRFGLSERDAAEAWAESMALHEDEDAARQPLDVEALMVAVFNADNPGDWPRWDDYIAAFGSAGTPPWRRKAERIASEYTRLTAKDASDGD